MKKFVITGGHHNSALVVAQELVRLGHRVEWFGHRRASVGDTHDSAEYIEVKATDIPFHELRAGKVGTRPTVTGVTKIPLGVIHAYALLRKIRPDGIISFGGYLGMATAIAGFLLGIPVFLHEQTVVAGKANRVTARFAKRIYLTWPSSALYYPFRKSMIVGLPLRKKFLRTTVTQLFQNPLPVIVVLGGKQGARILNQMVFDHLDEMLQNFNIIHQTGTSAVTAHYERAVALKETLPRELASHYEVRGYIGEDEIATFMKNADIVVGRSGAHTSYELGLIGKKAILIPYLYTHAREQLKNATILEQNGIAEIILEKNLTWPTLKEALTTNLQKPAPVPMALKIDAASVMVSDVLSILK